MWGLRWSKIIIILQLVTTGGLCSQSCGGVLVKQVIPKVQAFWKLARRSPWPLLTLKSNTLPFYRSSKRRVPYGVYIFYTLASSKSLKCVRSLTSFSVRSIGNFSRFAHASSKFLGFVSASMCIILYISRRFFAASSDFLGLRSGFVCISRQFIDC